MLNERRSKVLFVEDHPTNRQVIDNHLNSANYWAQESNRLHDSDQVWDADLNQPIPSVEELLERHFFHVAIIDLSLKELDAKDQTGFDVLETINRLHEGTKSIILTGYGKTRIFAMPLKDWEPMTGWTSQITPTRPSYF